MNPALETALVVLALVAVGYIVARVINTIMSQD